MLDGILLHFIKKELAQELTGARVIKIIQPLKEEILLTLKSKQNKEYSLLVGASSSCPRIYLTTEKLTTSKAPPMFCMLLRKHLLGGIVTEIKQENLDRIIYIEFDQRNQIGNRISPTLAIELMGRYSNIVLVNNNNRILGALKIIHGQRSIVTGEPYVKQEQVGKINLLVTEPTGTMPSLTDIQGLGKRACSLLKENFDSDSLILQALRDRLREHGGVTPTLVVDRWHPTFFDCKKTEGEKLYFSSFCELLDSFFKARLKADLLKQRTGNFNKIISTLSKRIINKIKTQREELESCCTRHEQKLKGDLLLANLHTLSNSVGLKSTRLKNFCDEQPQELTIDLNPRLTIAQNAQKYYKEHRKLQVAEKKLQEQIINGENELEYLNSITFGLSQATQESQLAEIRQELLNQGYIKIQKNHKQAKNKFLPKSIQLNTGNELLIGKNNLQNEHLTFKLAKRNDLWFHAQKVPGSHVILNIKTSPPQDWEIEAAAKAAAENSDAHNGSTVAVDFTSSKNVRKMPGGKPGMVNYINFKTIFVRLTNSQTVE
ncbi:MAG: NFACT family protein [Oscillospiraceae bacterium]|nr:NFACT family protein [Oscillospiraceae bacterium]